MGNENIVKTAPGSTLKSVAEPSPVVSASQVVDLNKIGNKVTLAEIREFVAQAAAFDGEVEVDLTCWQVDPSVSNRTNPSWETRMTVQWTPPSK